MLFTTRPIDASTPCADRGFDFFEQQGYVVRNVTIAGFFPLTRSLKAGSQFTSMEGKPFSSGRVRSQQSDLRAELRRSPSLFDSPIGVSVIGVRLVNCKDIATPKELDIEYAVFTTKLPLISIHTPEHNDLERAHPAEALALSSTKTNLRLTPVVEYDAAQRLRVGGRVEGQAPWAGTRWQLTGQGSSESITSSAAISATYEFGDGLIRKLTWRHAFEYDNQPSDRTVLESGRGLAQVSFLTKPFGRLGAVFRAGTLVEAGRQRTRLPQGILPASLLAGSSYVNWKTYSGFSMRAGRQSIAASYGLLLGHAHGGFIDYRKHIVDAVYDNRWLVSPHRPLEFNGRFTAGILTKQGPTPVSEQFFGGNVETPFVPGSEWVIRANPVMRGIPAYRLNRTSENQIPGIDRFSVVNLTVAIPIWGVPLIPTEASQDPEIRKTVQGFLMDGADALVPVFELDDPAQKELFVNERESFAKTTAALDKRVDVLKRDIPDSLNQTYERCAEKVGDLAADAASITKSTPWRNFIKDDPEERGIPVVVQLCLVDLNGSLRDTELMRLGEELKQHQRVIERQLAKIDTKRARRLAEDTLSFPSVVLNTVFDEMTIVSLSPMAMFDVGRIHPPAPGQRAMRYSAGGGARFTLASMVSFQLGYAWNIHPQPWEGRGALFFGMQIIDLFGK